VQHNCDIADARHAADMTLCIYLLQMREYFRWERGLGFGAALARDEIGAWIADREARWEKLEAHEYLPLPADDAPAGDLDPFDAEAVNARLRPHGLLYGAGLVGAGRPVFFLGELHERQSRDGLEVLAAGRELARGLLAPPAALGGEGRGPIVLRRESLARWGWEKREACALRPQVEGALRALVDAYGLDRDFAAALPRWIAEQGEMLVLHELGEHRVGHRLGPDWAAMRLALPGRRAELYARALRDQLADLEVTLPTLLERGAEAAASLHAWFANFDGVRELLYPTLPQAYARWRGGDGGAALRQAIATGVAHFRRLADDILAQYRQATPTSAAGIEALLTSPRAVCPG
jgi:hypothetical protein